MQVTGGLTLGDGLRADPPNCAHLHL